MAGNSFIQLPSDVSDNVQLRRFLDKLIQQVDIAFGNRGTIQSSEVLSLPEVLNQLNVINNSINLLKSDVSSLKAGELIVFISSNSSLSALTETVLCDCTLGEIQVTLPNPANCFSNSRSKVLSISKIDLTKNKVIIKPYSSESIVGDAIIELVLDGEIINLITDGTNWYLGA